MKMLKRLFCQRRKRHQKEEAELRSRFLGYTRQMIKYWERQDCAEREKLEGLAFSILVSIDGGVPDLPGFQLSPLGKPAIDIAGSLHDEI